MCVTQLITFEDETIIRRAKTRHAYWSKDNIVIFVRFWFCLTGNN